MCVQRSSVHPIGPIVLIIMNIKVWNIPAFMVVVNFVLAD